MTEPHDIALRVALNTWRQTKTVMVYGLSPLRDMGPSVIMTNDVLQRIIDCAHHHKINTSEELRRETGWAKAEQYSTEVLEIIKAHTVTVTVPLASPFSVVPLRPKTSLSINTASTTIPSTSASGETSSSHPNLLPKCRNKCGACGLEGHNGLFHLSIIDIFNHS